MDKNYDVPKGLTDKRVSKGMGRLATVRKDLGALRGVVGLIGWILVGL